jgi:hypothetical protein
VNAPAWYGAVAATAGLLALGGAMKAIKPNDTANALEALGVPGPRVVVRIGGAAEAMLGLWALVLGGAVPIALVGASYGIFAVFVAAAMRADTPVSSCGCFGEVDAPPTIMHIVLNVAAASVCIFTSASGPAPGLAHVVSNGGWSTVPLLGLTALTGYLAFLVMAVLPRVLTEAKVRP